jgi:L-2-hydroxyglutarate oxidase LhgO
VTGTPSTGAGGRIGIVGGGIIGLAVARRLLEARPDAEVVVVEKESDVGRHQSGHNSGVVHAGLYYPPGSLKATLCRRGVGLLREFCQEKGIAYDEVGKLVVALDATEAAKLADIEARARANGVPDLARVGSAGIRDLEPSAVGVAALHSPHTAIVDFGAVVRALRDDVVASGGAVRTGFELTDIRQDRGGVTLVPRVGAPATVQHLVVCAGLHSDRVARLAGASDDPRIIPFRGEYHRVKEARQHLVRGLIYPVPDPRYPFLGVHFTRRITGGVDVGPNAVLAFRREGYRRTDLELSDLRETLCWRGFRRLARSYWRTGAAEALTSVSKRAFIRRARRYVPALTVADIEPAPAGVRAQAVDHAGNLVDDFLVEVLGNVYAIRNAPSPAATSSLAIAEHFVEKLFSSEEAPQGDRRPTDDVARDGRSGGAGPSLPGSRA